MSMTYKQAIEYIHSLEVFGSRPGLERISRLCGLLGDPQKDLRCIHVAGTNGKGSVCAMLESVLRCAGLKTGLYTSPYVSFFEERIRADGAPVSKEKLAAAVEKVKTAADTLEDCLTEFEIITAAAFVFFKEEKCDAVVLETGLGGRLDATNIIENPVLSVITGIALDHTAVLGDTVEKIAAEKGGIIKGGSRAVIADCPDGALKVLKEIAGKKGAPVTCVDYGRIKDKRFSCGGTGFSVDPYGRIEMKLAGVYQADNAAVALTAAEAVNQTGILIPDPAIKEGLERAHWPARFETLLKEPLVIYDGAHNVNGAAALRKNIEEILSGRVILVTGVMADKDYTAIAKTLAPCIEETFTVTPDNPRALGGEQLKRIYSEAGVRARACSSVEEGIKKAVLSAKESGLPVIVSGTLYMYKQASDICKTLSGL